MEKELKIRAFCERFLGKKWADAHRDVDIVIFVSDALYCAKSLGYNHALNEVKRKLEEKKNGQKKSSQS